MSAGCLGVLKENQGCAGAATTGKLRSCLRHGKVPSPPGDLSTSRRGLMGAVMLSSCLACDDRSHVGRREKEV